MTKVIWASHVFEEDNKFNFSSIVGFLKYKLKIYLAKHDDQRCPSRVLIYSVYLLKKSIIIELALNVAGDEPCSMESEFGFVDGH